MDAIEARDLLQRAEIIINEHYDLGDVLSVGEIHGGYINRTFVVHVRTNDMQSRYVIRRYNPATEEEGVQFEHSVISHLRGNGFLVAAGVIPKRDGGTYVKEERNVEGRRVVRFWAVFEYLKGAVRYTFVDTNLSEAELTDSAETLARLHQAGRDFPEAAGANHDKPKVMDILPTLRNVYSENVRTTGDERFDQFLLKYREEVLEKMDHCLISEGDLQEMPELPIHGDYHQGNLTYEGSRVAGVFDFDWTKIDLRLFDMAQSLLYFCACWDGERAGSLDLGKVVLFLRSYNEVCREAAFPGPLSATEQACMPRMLSAANLFVMHAIIQSFYDNENADAEEWLMGLNHYMRILHWMEEEKDCIADKTRLACT